MRKLFVWYIVVTSLLEMWNENGIDRIYETLRSTSQPDKRKNPGGNGPNIGGFHFLFVFDDVLRSLHFIGLELLDEVNVGFLTLGDAPVFVTFASAMGRSNDDPDSTDISDSLIELTADLFGVDPGLSNSLRSFSFYKNNDDELKTTFFVVKINENKQKIPYLIVHAHR